MLLLLTLAQLVKILLSLVFFISDKSKFVRMNWARLQFGHYANQTMNTCSSSGDTFLLHLDSLLLIFTLDSNFLGLRNLIVVYKVSISLLLRKNSYLPENFNLTYFVVVRLYLFLMLHRRIIINWANLSGS